ncbi:hypothetical protein H920_19862 [Fukomys damarensis]|uniref:Uncharacterized protein n=1 Tax=Fukomys damarensis TaxID=885580 RepID=A0A091D749_FUKDA|nr:hypothetical protein H920_19862 [Fukomys damarensis]
MSRLHYGGSRPSGLQSTWFPCSTFLSIKDESDHVPPEPALTSHLPHRGNRVEEIFELHGVLQPGDPEGESGPESVEKPHSIAWPEAVSPPPVSPRPLTSSPTSPNTQTPAKPS